MREVVEHTSAGTKAAGVTGNMTRAAATPAASRANCFAELRPLQVTLTILIVLSVAVITPVVQKQEATKDYA